MLSPIQWAIARDTISSNAFYYIIKDTLERKGELSVVRMADGERLLMEQCLAKLNSPEIVEPPKGLDDVWLKWLGVIGIPIYLLHDRLIRAAEDCTYFAPSINGLEMPSYDMYKFWPLRDRFVDNFFPDQITTEQKETLFRTAGHVLLIHNNPHTADSMQLRVQANLECKVSYIKLAHWSEAEEVVRKAEKSPAPLVLFAAGPASKWIGPAIARSKKVTLDLGHAVDMWTMEHLPIDRAKAEAFHARWAAKVS